VAGVAVGAKLVKDRIRLGHLDVAQGPQRVEDGSSCERNRRASRRQPRPAPFDGFTSTSDGTSPAKTTVRPCACWSSSHWSVVERIVRNDGTTIASLAQVPLRR
jgi:hypothetical protein